MKNRIIFFLAFMGLVLNVLAQEKSNKELQGDKYMFRYAYDKAIHSYLSSKTLTSEGQRNLAVSYHNLEMNTESEAVYLNFINANLGVLPVDHFNYAMVLKSIGKYPQATIQMDLFSALMPTDLRAKDYLYNRNEADRLLNGDSLFDVVSAGHEFPLITNTDKIKATSTNFIKNKKVIVKNLDINTDAKDFGTVYYNNGIVFASTRNDSKTFVKKYNWTGKPFENIYYSEMDSGKLQTPKEFDKSFNKKLHEGPASFANDGNTIAYTSSNYRDKTFDNVVELRIYFSSKVDNKWTKSTPFTLNSQEYSVGQPCLLADGNAMYYTSDMPGGYGGTDIYRVYKTTAGEWGVPENLGNTINTEGDEMYPFVVEKSGVLIFTSNGRDGLGGLDIFNCNIDGSTFGKVHNAGSPLNTQYDDFAFIVNDSLTNGYFSSNRIAGKGDDDLYSFSLSNFDNTRKQITGIAKDIQGLPIANTFVTLCSADGVIIDTMTTNIDASFGFRVDTDLNFTLFGKQTAYMDGDTVANSFGETTIIYADIILLKKDEIIKQKIKVGEDLRKILAFDPGVIYFDYGKYNIRPDAIDDLNAIVKIMNEHPTMIVELGSHTDCRSTDAFNQTLSENRAKSSANYIKTRITKPERISGKGYGETRLVNACNCDKSEVTDCLEEIHQLNRRTEFIIIGE